MGQWKFLVIIVALVSPFAVMSKESQLPSFSAISPEHKVHLLELYTSEGCSSCPPADKWISQYMDNDQLWQKVIPLSFHVDYWDYIGWKDRFAKPSYTLRQRLLRENGQTGSVYTPQFVFDGDEWRGFFKRWFGRDELPFSTTEAGKLSIYISQEGDIQAGYNSVDVLPKHLLLNVALLASDIHSDVTTGENHDKRLEHDFVVLGYQAYQANTEDKEVKWTGIAPAVPLIANEAKKLAWVAWVSHPSGKGHLQATGGWVK